MPSRPILACLLSAAFSPGAYSVYTWGLAPEGESCAAYCSKKNEQCIPGHWPQDAYKLLQVSVAAEKLTCTNIKVTSSKQYAPSVADSTDSVEGHTDCFYNIGVGDTGSSCAEVIPVGKGSRLCPCSPSIMQWFVADEGASCRDTCRAKGGVCGDEMSVWPSTQQMMQSVATYAGRHCKTTSKGDKSFHPSIGKDDDCYFPTTDAGDESKPFCDAADWESLAQKRICPCWDVVQ